MPPKRQATEDLSNIRLKSRQDYLAKREQIKLAELRHQVAEEQEELRSNPHLTEREKRSFARNLETLKLAEARAAIDETQGFFIPDATNLSEEKSQLLAKRHKEEEYVSEVQQWENEVTSRANAAKVHKSERTREDDYEFVFDESTAVQFDMDLIQVDPKKRMLEEQLDAAEKKAKSIREVREGLPVYQYKDDIIKAISDNPILVFIGETGSGKTTQLPQFILESMNNRGIKDKMVACTQPRRVAAMSVAQRVSSEMGVRLGEEVGYSIRFEAKFGDKTRIKYLTEGMMLKELMSSPVLDDYHAVIIDEAHERSVNTDLLIGITKDIVRARPDFRLIIASATLNAQVFSNFYDSCPIFSVPGRSHKVSISYTLSPESDYIAALCISVMQVHISQPFDASTGDILCFLPGESEIQIAQESIEETVRKCGGRIPELLCLPLYSALSSDLQAKVFEPKPPRLRRVILSTNVAETSVTIDGISWVIDSGYEKQMQYNQRTGLSSLVVTPISRASANQRAGRAGRTGPGNALRLWTRHSHYSDMPESTPPEITRVDLTSTVLTLLNLGINDILHFDFLDPPPPDSIIAALEQLYALGAISSNGELSNVGRRMANLPLAPMQAKMILEADQLGAVDEILIIAAMTSESGALFLRPKDKKIHADAARRQFVSREAGDHGTLLNVYKAFVESGYDPLWCKSSFLNYRSLVRVRDVLEQLVNLCERVEVNPSSAGTDHVAIRKAITSGYFSHAARLQRDGHSYTVLKSNLTVWIHPSSVYSSPEIPKPKWVLYSELVLTSKEYMRNVVEIDPAWLMEIAPFFFKKGEIEKFGVDKKMPKGQGKVGVDVGSVSVDRRAPN